MYYILGRKVGTLVNEEKPAGNYQFDFNGSCLPSGIYYYQIKAGSFVQSRKMILLK
ncbi:MAG: T9SS type A sorting domain-containing protein [Ignavibacteriales bacterium]|nr:T9SS type A sorting domain-containing protein [Ignavibacteriales bacterium]